jgi:hypothetical protein
MLVATGWVTSLAKCLAVAVDAVNKQLVLNVARIFLPRLLSRLKKQHMVSPPRCISLLMPVALRVLVLARAPAPCPKRVALAAVADPSLTIKGSSRCRHPVDHAVVKAALLNTPVPHVEVQVSNIVHAM